MTDFLPDGSWADPLSRKERRELARKLARWCKRFYEARAVPSTPDPTGCIMASADMSDLHLDVTERAKVATS